MHPDISLHPIKTINIKVYIHVQIIQTFRQGGWGVHPNPEIRGGAVSKKVFSALQASVWSKNKGALPWSKHKGGPSPGSATYLYSQEK